MDSSLLTPPEYNFPLLISSCDYFQDNSYCVIVCTFQISTFCICLNKLGLSCNRETCFSNTLSINTADIFPKICH